MAIKTLPILFNTEMVQAILDNRKTATRRRPFQLPERFSHMKLRKIEPCKTAKGDRKLCAVFGDGTGVEYIVPSRYKPGDILYVRETFCEEAGKYYFRADFESDYLDACETFSGGYPASCRYRDCDMCMAGPQRIYWRPSIHMPKEAARIFLQVKSVRVERLRDITEEQAQAEGLYKGWTRTKTSSMAASAKQAFMWVWDTTIKRTDRALYGWLANPWVWVIEFERCEKPAGWLA